MSTLPDRCAVAFKEWAGVCRALAEGRQTVILRKGGIDEGPGGFAPEHAHFWLYPTFVHQARQGLREPSPGPEADPPRTAPADPRAPVAVHALASVALIRRVGAEEQLDALLPFHVWTAETVRRRFSYRRPGLWVLGVRVFRLDEPWTIVPTDEQLGCKSWAPLDVPHSTEGLRPVLDDHEHERRLASLRSVLP